MIELPYSLVIEATEDPTFFGFHSPELVGFTGSGIPSRTASIRPVGGC